VFAKLCLLILVFGSCSGGVLAMRQSRLQAAHELAESRLRVREHEQRLRELRAQIASLSNPERVRELGARAIDASLTPSQDTLIELEPPLIFDETHEAFAPALDLTDGEWAP
jgi:septal ring factor EnvC (AmiA/AmiB activator)